MQYLMLPFICTCVVHVIMTDILCISYMYICGHTTKVWVYYVVYYNMHSPLATIYCRYAVVYTRQREVISGYDIFCG